MEDKTVYILGAGFSMDAGAPSQAELVKTIYDLKEIYKKTPKSIVLRWVEQFDNFLTNCLMVDDNSKLYYNLEDIYTPIDRSIADGAPFRNYTFTDLVELRDVINRLIILAIRKCVERKKKPQQTITKFANYLIKQGRERLNNEKTDTIAVITTNWDIMLDNYLNNLMSEETPVKDAEFCGVVDYCCYISSLKEDDNKIKPGLYAIGKGGYNVKILKLHGSLNWMQCPRCQRLYVEYYKHFSGGYIFKEKFCRHCERNFKILEDASIKLGINLIMPTFLKNLSNVQNKLIWQNTGIELAEASKVVFLGYSLPQADFEFKQLLSRMIRTNAEIEVVLLEADNPKNGPGVPTNHQTAGYRYEVFFSGRQLKISYDGVGSYINNLN